MLELLIIAGTLRGNCRRTEEIAMKKANRHNKKWMPVRGCQCEKCMDAWMQGE